MFTLRVQIYDIRQKCTFTVHRAHRAYQRKIDVHLNMWREIMEFITWPNQLQKFASI